MHKTMIAAIEKTVVLTSLFVWGILQVSSHVLVPSFKVFVKLNAYYQGAKKQPCYGIEAKRTCEPRVRLTDNCSSCFLEMSFQFKFDI